MQLDVWSGLVFLAVAAAAAALTLKRPALGICALIAVDPFAWYHWVGHTTITLPKAALLGVGAGLFFGGFRCGHGLPRAARALLYAELAVLAATALSAVVAADRTAVLREVLRVVLYLIVFATAAIAEARDPHTGWVPDAIAATGAVVAVLALGQLAIGATSFVPVDGLALPRVAGPLEGPNQLAGYLGIALPLTLSLLARRPGLYGAAAVAQAIALVLTGSRAGIATTAASIATIAIVDPALRGAVIRTAALGYALGFAALAGASVALTHSLDIFRHLFSAEDARQAGGVGSRARLWRAAWTLYREHPLLGIGAGNFELEVGPFASLGTRGSVVVRTHANSWYLQSLVEGGIPLFAATLAVVAAALVGLARGIRRDPFVLGSFAAALGLALHQIVDYLIFYPKVGDMWWIVLGVACARQTVASSEPIASSAAPID